MRRYSWISILALALVACGGGQKSVTTGGGDDKIGPADYSPAQPVVERAKGHPSDTLIPRKTFFGDPDKVAAQISADGKHLSYLAPHEGVLNIWVAPVDALDQAKVITDDRTRPVRIHFWSYDNRHVLYVQDTGGDEDWHAYSVDIETGEKIDLSPVEGKIQARILAVSHKDPGHVLLGLNDRDPRHHDVYKVDINTGERTLVQQNEGFAGFEIDDDFKVRMAMRINPDGSEDVLVPDKKEGWKPLMTIPHEDTLTTSIVHVPEKGNTVYLVDSRDRDTAGFFSLNLKNMKRKLIAEHDKADAGGIMMHPKKQKIEAVSFTYLRREWKILDPAVKADFKALARVDDGEFSVVDRTLDDRRWIVAFYGDKRPVKYYLWERKGKKARFLFSNRAELESLDLSPMHPVVIPARDGLELVSYLTLPTGSDEDGDARPAEARPMVLLVHGGPWGRDNWGYNSLHQWLSSRGYAVLSVNFRGSTGFGKAFTNAGDGEWGRKMHNDLLDATKWAIDQGVTREDKVCIMGGSYGGYATLVGLTMTPETFACGVDIVGPSNLITLVESIPAYWAPIANIFRTRMGDWETEDGRKMLTERSPLTHADQIVRPLLIGQGANDPRVKKQESDQIVAAMNKSNIPVTYVLFPDEGHGFARPANRMAFFAVVEGFLSAHLGGTYQPMTGEDFDGSSIVVKSGHEGVPGLPEDVGRPRK